jgi:polyisoprenyl-phosphate glycosyltransferase
MQSAAELLIPRRQPALLSIVIPLYNEQEMVPLLRRHLQSILEKSPCPWELILVNDGSSDGTLAALRQWAAEEPNVVALALSRNFGHQAAATAGLDVASGDAIVLMDADLQDPPELVFEMLAKYIEGYDVVYAQRRERLGESWFKRHSAWLFYRMMRLAIDKRLPPDTGDYRLISRQCLDALRQMREQHRFLRGMVAWVGFPQTAVRFVRQPRAAGESKYPLRKMIRFAWTAALSFSPTPLRVVFFLSFLVALIGLVAGGYSLTALLMGLPVVPGWTSIMVTQSLIGACILLSIGVAGEYVAKIYEESKGRPLYIVDRERSIDKRAAQAARAAGVAGMRQEGER